MTNTSLRSSMSFAIGMTEPQCEMCCHAPAVTNLDGDNLCKKHADDWARLEGESFWIEHPEP